MRRSRAFFACAGAGAMAALVSTSGCASLVGIEDIVVVDGDADAARDGEGDASVSDASSGRADASGDAGASGCLTTRDAGRSCESSGNTAQGGSCTDDCQCSAGLYCARFGAAGACCKAAPCGATCASSCDCLSNFCLDGRCR